MADSTAASVRYRTIVVDQAAATSNAAFSSQFERVNAFLPQLKDATERYETAPNWATVAALCTICAAVDGQDWAVRDVLTNPDWSLDE